MTARFVLSVIGLIGMGCLSGCESESLFRRGSCCQPCPDCPCTTTTTLRKVDPKITTAPVDRKPIPVVQPKITTTQPKITTTPPEIKAIPVVKPAKKKPVEPPPPPPPPLEERYPPVPQPPARPKVPPLTLPPVTSRVSDPVEMDLSLPARPLIQDGKIESLNKDAMILLDPEISVDLAKRQPAPKPVTDIAEVEFRQPRHDVKKDTVPAQQILLPKQAGNNEDIVTTVPMRIQLGQLDNYQQITGQLVKWRNSWRVRYAPVEADDPHGGSVVLESVSNPGSLRDGQIVRVRGRLVPSSTRHSPTQYVVQSLEPLD